jgi:hypothetical protein
MAVIEERIVVGEALGGEQLLRIQGAVGLPELGVTFVRNVAQTMVVWHIECVLGFRSFSGEDKGGTDQSESSSMVRRKTYFHFLLSIQ